MSRGEIVCPRLLFFVVVVVRDYPSGNSLNAVAAGARSHEVRVIGIMSISHIVSLLLSHHSPDHHHHHGFRAPVSVCAPPPNQSDGRNAASCCYLGHTPHVAFTPACLLASFRDPMVLNRRDSVHRIGTTSYPSSRRSVYVHVIYSHFRTKPSLK